jgi:hypothetical protein
MKSVGVQQELEEKQTTVLYGLSNFRRNLLNYKNHMPKKKKKEKIF